MSIWNVFIYLQLKKIFKNKMFFYKFKNGDVMNLFKCRLRRVRLSDDVFVVLDVGVMSASYKSRRINC